MIATATVGSRSSPYICSKEIGKHTHMQTNARVLRCATDGLGEDDDIVGDGLDMIDNIFDQVVNDTVPTDEEPLKSIVFPSIVHGLAHACNDNLKIASGSCQVQVRLPAAICRHLVPQEARVPRLRSNRARLV